MITQYKLIKVQEKMNGLYPITKLRMNHAVKVRHDPTSYIEETFNIRKSTPYKGQVDQNNNTCQIINLLNIYNMIYPNNNRFNHWWRRV